MPLLNGASATDAFWLGLILSFSQSVSFDLKLKVDIVNLLWPSRTSFPILIPAPTVISGHPDVLVLWLLIRRLLYCQEGEHCQCGRWQTGVGWTRILWQFPGILSRKISLVVSIPFPGGGRDYVTGGGGEETQVATAGGRLVLRSVRSATGTWRNPALTGS